MRDDALAYLADPDAVPAAGKTGFLKKGTHSVSVSRHYSGAAGRIKNCQIGVFFAYSGDMETLLIDRERYLARE